MSDKVDIKEAPPLTDEASQKIRIETPLEFYAKQQAFLDKLLKEARERRTTDEEV